MKSLYDEKYRQTKEGQDLYQKTQEVIGSVFRNFAYKGYSPHEISTIICESVTMLKMHVILEQESYKAQQVIESNVGESK